MSNQELVDAGMKTMNETDQAIERSKQVNELCESCSTFLYL
jgi:SNARE protein